MSDYAEQHLGSDEMIVAETRRHTIWLIMGIISCCLIVLLPLGILLIIEYYRSEFTLTTERVICKNGLLRLAVHEIQLDKIQSVSLLIPFFGQQFDYGTILIYTASGAVFHFRDIKGAEEFKVYLTGWMEKYKDRCMDVQAKKTASEIAKVLDE